MRRAALEERHHAFVRVGSSHQMKVQLGFEIVDRDAIGRRIGPQQVLAHGHRHRRDVDGDVAGDLERSRQHLRCIDRLVGEAPAFGVVAAEHLAGQQDLGRASEADDARQRPMRIEIGHHAAAILHDAELRVVGHDAQVAVQRHRQPHADRRAVDGRDHRLAHLPRRVLVRIRVERAAIARCAEHRGPAREVGARAERAAGTGDHDRAHLVVGVAVAIRVLYLVAHLRAEGVEHLGTVEGDRRDAVVDREQNVLVAHRSRPYMSALAAGRSGPVGVGLPTC